MPHDSNADQSAFWNMQSGQSWVDNQADLDLLMGPVADLVIALAHPMPGERVIDAGCGAGATTFLLAEAVGPTGEVAGADISAPLIAHAQARQAALGMRNVSFVLGDVQDHRFSPGAHDLVASRFGVMFFADPVAAFANLARALRPGGRIAFAAWAERDANPWFEAPSRHAMARLGPGLPAPPDGPGPMAFRDVARVCGLMAAGGFVRCAGRRVATGLRHPGGLGAVLRLATRVGPMAALMREKSGTAADEAAILAALGAEFEGYATAEDICIPAAINLFSGSRP